MTYKVGSIPETNSSIEEKADFWEVTALQKRGNFVPQLAICGVLSKEFDEHDHDGIESEDDKLGDSLDDVFKELERRGPATLKKYPFRFNRYAVKLLEEESICKDVYLFLLLCTRFNMKIDHVHEGLDATRIFEELCAWVAQKYFGENAESYVFGTAAPGSFEDKVKEIISKIGEGHAFVNREYNEPTKKDGGVDVVVWKEFADKRPGKLIGLGQCKTGTTWKNHVSSSKIEKFCGGWFRDTPVFEPIPLFFISDTLTWGKDYRQTQGGHLFFNRFRILEFVDESIPDTIMNDIGQWLEGALKSLDSQT